MMDKILRGAKPGNLPILYPERYFLTLNRTAARQIGLKFPERLLARADRVIDLTGPGMSDMGRKRTLVRVEIPTRSARCPRLHT